MVIATIGGVTVAAKKPMESLVSTRDIVIALNRGENGPEASELVGERGSRNMDPTAGLVVRVSGDALEQYRNAGGIVDNTSTGLVVGTTTGSPASMIALTTDTWTQARPYLIETGTIPYAILNGAAARAAIWHELQGPNATVGGTEMAVVKVLEYSLTLLEMGRAEIMICAVGEEKTPESAWLHSVSHEDVAAGPGAAAFVLGLDSGLPGATGQIRELGSMFCGDRGRMAEMLIARVLDVVKATSDSEMVAVIGAGLHDLPKIDEGWASVFLERVPVVEHIEDMQGDCGAAGGFLALAVALSRITSAVASADAEMRVKCSALVLVANDRSEVGWILLEDVVPKDM